MNPNEIIQHYLHGMATDAEVAELDRLLASDRALRRKLIVEMGIDAGLCEIARERASQPSVVAPRRSVWLSWRPLMAAAAGIVLGMFCTSMVFGYVMPRAVATATRLLTLVDGGFEDGDGRVSPGFPVQYGVWSGERAERLASDEVKAPEGKQLLRFIEAERDPSQLTYRPAACDVYQLVDLSTLKQEIPSGGSTLELSVSFLDARLVQGEQVKFIASLYVFSGKPSDLPMEWLQSQHEALSSGSGFWRSVGGDPSRWQAVTARAVLPPGADFALVHLMVADRPVVRRSHLTQGVFGQHYADDVRITITSQPELPIRLAER